MRVELEPLAAVLARERMTAEDFAGLLVLLQNLRSAKKKKNYAQLLNNDMAFHQRIWNLSGNVFLEP